MGMFDLLRSKLKRLGSESETAAKAPLPPGEHPATPPTARTPEPEKSPFGSAAAPFPAAPQTQPPSPAGTPRGIRPGRVQELLYDLELMLLEADVALPAVSAIQERFQARLARVDPGSDAHAAVANALKESLVEVLSQHAFAFDKYVLDHEKPVVIMFVGVNGTGKTTQIAKLAHRLRAMGYSSVLAAADTFRAGAIEQIEKHSERLNMKVVKHASGGDPAAVAYDAIQHASSRKKDVVLIDTAGRMQTNVNLMDEMKKVKRVAKPHLIVFVGDALAGNDAIEQARKFDEAVGIDCAILAKVDTDAKGGAALSIAHAVGKPVAFLGVGQEYDDLIPFDPKWVVDRIFGE